MTHFRPERKVTDPEGRMWEIYVSRSTILSRLRLADPPRTAVVEAVCFFPGRRTTHRWTVSSDNVDAVVEQVVRGLEDGEIARPLGTTYEDPRLRPRKDAPSLDGD